MQKYFAVIQCGYIKVVKRQISEMKSDRLGVRYNLYSIISPVYVFFLYGLVLESKKLPNVGIDMGLGRARQLSVPCVGFGLWPLALRISLASLMTAPFVALHSPSFLID